MERVHIACARRYYAFFFVRFQNGLKNSPLAKEFEIMRSITKYLKSKRDILPKQKFWLIFGHSNFFFLSKTSMENENLQFIQHPWYVHFLFASFLNLHKKNTHTRKTDSCVNCFHQHNPLWKSESSSNENLSLPTPTTPTNATSNTPTVPPPEQKLVRRRTLYGINRFRPLPPPKPTVITISLHLLF